MDGSKSEVSKVQADTSTINETEDSKDGKSCQNDDVVEREKIKKQATLLFLQGKRCVYIKDFQGAIAALSESCQLFNQIYSEQDDALADPYFYYGKALLEIGRNESEVLGDQVQGNENSKSDNEDDDDDDNDNENDDENDDDNDDDNNDGNDRNNEDDMNVNESNVNNIINVEENTNNLDCKVNGNGITSEKNNTINNGVQAGSCINNKDNVDATTDKSEAENEEINDLQLSWEYLELAKLIYLRKADTCKDTAIKLAETYLCLGENGLESENYSVAIEDIKQALALQKVHLHEIDRRIAETYYQLGVAYSLTQNHDEAIKNFNVAIEHLRKKILSLEKRKEMGDKKTAEEEKDAFYTMEGEIKEIEILIKDIEEKIRDMHECENQIKQELLKQIVSNEKTSESSATNASHSSSSTIIPATDISHLIKKKRKNDEEDTNTLEKKSKIE